MKKLVIFFVMTLLVLGLNGQDISGQWNGALKVQGTQLRIVFNISKIDKGYTSTMDSPDQGAKGIPVTATTFENSKLKLEMVNLRAEFNGELKENQFEGTFKQNGTEFPMTLSREKIEKQTVKRPQNPVKPYSYYSEEVTFQNAKANIQLAGTLTLPKKEGRFPAVVLITGSGPQNRDEEIMGHRPFLVISDYLTRNGIAVLRFDDRGVAQSKGDFKTATTLDFATDVESAVAYLQTRKEINKNKIGLMGHSEGGIIAPMVASHSKVVRFIVMLAGTGLRGDKILLTQQELIARASGASNADIDQNREINTRAFELILKSQSDETIKSDLKAMLTEQEKIKPSPSKPNGMPTDDFIALQVNQTANPWMLFFIKYDPAPALEKVRCPVLAINGEKDLQVSSKENLPAIEKALKACGNKKVTIKEYPGLNHLFQECKTGLPTEYAQIEQTFSPKALEEITKWVLETSKK